MSFNNLLHSGKCRASNPIAHIIQLPISVIIGSHVHYQQLKPGFNSENQHLVADGIWFQGTDFADGSSEEREMNKLDMIVGLIIFQSKASPCKQTPARVSPILAHWISLQLIGKPTYRGFPTDFPLPLLSEVGFIDKRQC